MRDLQENLIYRRLSLKTSPRGGFIYVLHIPETNFIQFGLGFETANALQRKHVASESIHQLACHEESNRIARSKALSLKVDRYLSEIFNGHPEADTHTISDVDGATDVTMFTPCKWLAQAIRDTHDEAWGSPYGWEPEILSLGDGRAVWALYDDDADKIRLGIGFIDEANEPVLGDNSYILSKDFIAEFVSQVWVGRALFFFSVPPRWSMDFDQAIDNPADLKSIAKMVLDMADTVWPGEVEALDDDGEELSFYPDDSVDEE